MLQGIFRCSCCGKKVGCNVIRPMSCEKCWMSSCPFDASFHSVLKKGLICKACLNCFACAEFPVCYEREAAITAKKTGAYLVPAEEICLASYSNQRGIVVSQ